MKLADWLRTIANAMPEDGAVMLPVRELRARLQNEPIGRDLTIQEVIEYHYPRMSEKRLRRLCAQKVFPHAYKLGREWLIPESDIPIVRRMQEQEQDNHVVPIQRQQSRPLRRSRRKVDTGAWRKIGNA